MYSGHSRIEAFGVGLTACRYQNSVGKEAVFGHYGLFVGILDRLHFYTEMKFYSLVFHYFPYSFGNGSVFAG